MMHFSHLLSSRILNPLSFLIMRLKLCSFFPFSIVVLCEPTFLKSILFHGQLSMEKKELQDDNSTLEAQIDKLEGEVKERVAETNLDLNLSLTETQLPQLASQVTDNFLQLPGSEHPFQQMQMMNSLYVVPLNSTPQAYPEPDAAKPAAMPTYSVKKPQARYPTPADVWPSQILE